ncbi:tyrosine-type recombinase/integrase [Lentibacillus sp. Marseille-P4043]|uniref:tyrosine-type recombinase/integrase n=1 Tax=Lentibacillus sp. Marseille-P4043 TaxID=2040293 RepID=UPI00131A512B|nr:tyrosine-type recombinase/integrase [Lentibacillus sp. Marseille-P4043]
MTGKRNQIKRRGKTQKEAKQKVLTEIDNQTNAGVNRKITKNITFDKLAEEWMKTYKLTNVKESTIDARTTEMKALNKQMAKKPIDKIDHLFYQNVIQEVAKGRKENTVRNINACANMIFKFAKKHRLISENPVTDVVLPKKKKTLDDLKTDKTAEKYWEREELKTFLSAVLIYGERLDKEIFYTFAFSGMRVGELCALQKSDLDFNNNTINVLKTVYSKNQNMYTYTLDTPKTNNSVRTIEMEQPIMDMLRKLVQRNDEHKMKYRLQDDYQDMDYVFARLNGRPYFRGDINKRIKRILRLAKIKRHATSHIFRHTHISMLTEAGVDLPTIMQRVGHRDSKTTLEIYTHVTKKMKENASEKIRGKFGDMLQKITNEK